MINISDYDVFKNALTTLKVTSKDKTNNVFMTESNAEVINFDKVVKNYCASRHMPMCPDSVDALLIKDENNAVMIEFKNGLIDNKKDSYRLAKKIYDSIFVISDITNQSIRYTREHLDYILVYNIMKNPEDKKTEYRESASRNMIANTIAGYAKTKHIRFGLEVFEQYCFRNVYTYSKEEFESKVTNLF